MAQKILGARSRDPSLGTEVVEVAIDQVVLARAPGSALSRALDAGLKKTSMEVAVVYDGLCVTGLEATLVAPGTPRGGARSHAEYLARGVMVARPGIGFPAPVHLERFASPARLCVTDEPRLAGVGGMGMLTLVVPPASLGRALAQGVISLRRPVSVQVLLSGRLRPFVCARDVSLELLRRGLADVLRRIEEKVGAPVIVEFAGPSVRSLSVGERAVIASVAPRLGAAAALFVADERTEVFLRDQRRSKAHRALSPDAGSPCEEVVTIDLSAVDPLVLDEEGRIRAVRDLAGQPVSQVLLGGDGGVSLRDLLATATLLKSKRVAPRIDFLFASPSRQMLEVLAASGALTDLVATGVRVVEPDARVVRGSMYRTSSGGTDGAIVQTFDREPSADVSRRGIVASAETLAYAVAHGQLGDPRTFKRPVRVIVPRVLPTDDVLLTRKAERGTPPRGLPAERVEAAPRWKTAQTLDLVGGPSLEQLRAQGGYKGSNGTSPVAVLCTTLEEVRDLSSRAHEIAPLVRAVVATHIPAALVALLSAAGIVALRIDSPVAIELDGQRSIALPPPHQWPERQPTLVSVGASSMNMTWLAVGDERAWTTGAPYAPPEHA